MRLSILACVSLVLPALATAADIPKGGSFLLSKNSAGSIANSESGLVSMSANGKRIGFTTLASNLGPGTSNGFEQVFAYKRSGASLGVASKSTLDAPANLDCGYSKLSANGRYVALETKSSLFVDGVISGFNQVFRRDLKTGEVVLASATSTGSQVDGHSRLFDLSADGRFVVFESHSKNVVPGVTKEISRAYVRDLELGTTILVSQNSAGVPLSNATYNPRISANGRYVFFASASPELDGINKIGTYVRDLKKGTTKTLSRNYLGEVANGPTEFLGVSENGRFVVMYTEATNLASVFEGGVVLLDRSKGVITAIKVAKPNLTADWVGDSAIVANDGSRVWVQVHYSGAIGSSHQVDLLEVNRKTKEVFTRISLEGYDPMAGRMDMEGSATAEWIAVSTDEKITDSTGFVDSNAQHDVYVLRAH
jgi:Tol biopolymer transport system component